MFRFALQNILSRPLRNLLALLGLTVAITGMVSLFSVSAGLKDTIDSTFGRVHGLAAMQSGSPIPIFSRIPAEWADELAAQPGVRRVRRELWARAQLLDGKPAFNPPRFLFGLNITDSLALSEEIYRDSIVEGRYLNQLDEGKLNCVISLKISRQLHKGLGEQIRVDGSTLTIVGIYDCGSLFFDVAILIDQATFRTLVRFSPNDLSSIYIEPDGTIPNDQLVKNLQQQFRGRRLTSTNSSETFWLTVWNRLTAAGQSGSIDESPATESNAAAVDDSPLEIRSARDWGGKIQELSGDLDIVLWLVNGIGVVVALLSILNSMIMSVAERLTEFGVLKANGWTKGNILSLVLWESILLGIAGGMIGCLTGWSITQIANAWLPDRINLVASPAVLIFSLMFSIGIGALGGLYPALWAVRLPPMKALRL